MQPINAILFDHDGTLVDSEPVHFHIWHDVLKPLGVALTLDEYAERHTGVSTHGNATRFLNDYPFLTISATALADAKQAATDAFLASGSFPLMPGARETLQYFAELGLDIAIVTGSTRAEVMSTVESHGLHDLVDTVVSCDDVTANKPAPDCYQLAARRLGSDPSECIAVEDTESGVTAAVAAGIQCFAVASPTSAGHDLSKAARHFSDLIEARRWIATNMMQDGPCR